MSKKNFKPYNPPKTPPPWMRRGITPDYQVDFMRDIKGLDQWTKNQYPNIAEKPLEARLVYMISDLQDKLKRAKEIIEKQENELKECKR